MTECSMKFHKYRFLIPLILIFVVSLLNVLLKHEVETVKHDENNTIIAETVKHDENNTIIAETVKHDENNTIIVETVKHDENKDNDFIKYIHLEINMRNKSLRWCAWGIRSTGIGNRLSQYWIDRAIAFWFNMKFSFNPNCHCNKKIGYHFCNKLNPITNSSNLWTQFLRQTSNFTFISLASSNSKLYEKYKNLSLHIYKYYDMAIKQEHKHLIDAYWRYPHHRAIALAAFNNLLFDVIRNDMDDAFNSYFLQKKVNDGILKEYEYLQEFGMKNSVIIHFRCGDILTAKTSSSYGFAGFSYYRDALKIWNLNKHTTNGQMIIYILINLNKQKARKLDIANIDSCKQLIYLLKPGLDELFKYIGIVQIAGNGTINTDSYIISHAEYVLCAASTFCQYLTIGNPYNIIRTPNGLWQRNPDFKEFFPKNIKMLEYGSRHLHINQQKTPYNVNTIANWIMTH